MDVATVIIAALCWIGFGMACFMRMVWRLGVLCSMMMDVMMSFVEYLNMYFVVDNKGNSNNDDMNGTLSV